MALRLLLYVAMGCNHYVFSLKGVFSQLLGQRNIIINSGQAGKFNEISDLLAPSIL